MRFLELSVYPGQFVGRQGDGAVSHDVGLPANARWTAEQAFHLHLSR